MANDEDSQVGMGHVCHAFRLGFQALDKGEPQDVEQGNNKVRFTFQNEPSVDQCRGRMGGEETEAGYPSWYKEPHQVPLDT